MRAVAAVLVGLIAAGCVTITFAEVEESPTAQTAAVIPSVSPSALASPSFAETSSAPPSPTPSVSAAPSPEVTSSPLPTPSKPATRACADDAYTLSGYQWMQSMNWTFRESSTPAEYDAAEVLEVLKASFENITGARNDCGRPDNVEARSLYHGATRLEPCEEGEFGDGWNVIGFGPMPADLPDAIAMTCPYAYDNGRTSEVDIVINEDVAWALSADDCRGFEEMLEATVTHEIGHAFGLGHVSERRHGDLTMSTRSNGACNNEESTLGLGDMLGLEELYPID